MKRILRNIALALVTGYIFFYFGERVFWSFPHPGDTLISNLLAWLLYSYGAYLTLIIIEHFRVRTWWAVFLAGAFFGWLIEGVFAMTLFGGGGLPFPIGISWTGLAWHALISVFIGWYWVMMFLNGNHYKKTIFFSIAFGIFWGVWFLAWVLETPPITTTPDIYLLHGLITTFFLCVSYYLFSKLRPAEFISSRWEKIILALPVLAFFAFVTVPEIGHFAAILPVLFGILYFALKKNRDHEKTPPVYDKDAATFKEHIKQLEAITVKDVMNADPLVFDEDALPQDAIGLFRNHHKVNPVPVVNKAREVIGIVSRFDIVKFFIITDFSH